ncbi:protease inhibitor I42 family protein [Nocardia tengchongensis]|uniref:Protease inhibitor I42 family protein n=1 Tax=Nocardia tengchongensis TaxID=2055889 RepID=A0ABX8CQ26_9NOCA|nr:protease inhibitor I42 family protein [Nocardia tengchongensis]QVI21128.1 protease inhibitor I42 family protein [Nocardia tengchongensis]
MRLRMPLVMVTAGLALAGCGSSGSNEATPLSATSVAVTTAASPTAHAAERIGADADGKDVSLEVGQGLIVTLEANPTTGYAWQVGELDQKVVKPNGSPDYEQDSNPDGKVGVGGKSVLNFVAAAPGSTTLSLSYMRAWEQGVEPAKRFTVNVTVR